jgi:tetratricopeptide (TPR) repeat protein
VAPILARPPILTKSKATAFTPRVPSLSRYFDPELLAVYESLVLEHVPELCAHRAFAPVVYRDHLLFALFNLQCASLEGRLDEVARLARDAHTAWPDHPYVTFMAGDALRKLGHHDTALPYLEKAVRLAPHDAEIIVSCINAQIALEHLDHASELATQLVALLPGDASHRLLLATILMMSGRAADALQQALHALDLGIGDPHLWRAFGRMVHEARQAGWALQLAPTD